MLQFLPALLLVPGLWAAFRDLATSWSARSDLAAAIAQSGPDVAARLRALVAADDVAGVVMEIRRHLNDLPDGERRVAEDSLAQPSENGRRSYAKAVLGPTLRQHRMKFS